MRRHYDLSLLEGLDYRGPQLLFDAVTAACRTLGRDAHFDRALDLGCGTGLAGAAVRPRVDSLVGVDLSPAMVEQARRKTGSTTVSMSATCSNSCRRESDACADLVIAADVAALLRATSRRSRSRLRGCWTTAGCSPSHVETHDGDGVLLRETLRYAHGEGHVRTALALPGSTCVSLDAGIYRKEKDVPVPGLVVVAAKPASTVPPSGASLRVTVLERIDTVTLPEPFARWFAQRGWTPRAHQLELAGKARAGRSVLLIAPTGAGKTLAGFLPSWWS